MLLITLFEQVKALTARRNVCCVHRTPSTKAEGVLSLRLPLRSTCFQRPSYQLENMKLNTSQLPHVLCSEFAGLLLVFSSFLPQTPSFFASLQKLLMAL